MATPGKELPTLLFTPRPAEGRESRTPHHAFSGQRSPSAGATAGTGLFHTATPSRDGAAGSAVKRRSLTPGTGTPKDTPPPPPSDSLFDIRSGVGPSPIGDHSMAAPGTAGQRTPGTASRQPLDNKTNMQMPKPDALELIDTWVTVFGFNANDLPLVLREFQKCGDVLVFDNFSPGVAVNWIHLQYQTKHSAQRALLKNGEQLSSTIIVGVKPMDPRLRQVLAQQHPCLLSELPKPKPEAALPARTHRVSSGAMAPVPRPDNSVWTRVSEVLFGL